MNLAGRRLSFGNLFGQRCRQITEAWSHRGMCSKVQEVKAEPAHEPRPGFKTPGYRPTATDRKILMWSGRFKTVDQIPEIVSFEMIDAARNKVRVKACYVMIAVTLGGCVLMVIMGKQAAGRNESLLSLNMEKKAKWKEELEKEKQSAAALSQKVQ